MLFDDVEATNNMVTTELHIQTNYLICLPQTKPFFLPSLINLPQDMLNEIRKITIITVPTLVAIFVVLLLGFCC